MMMSEKEAALKLCVFNGANPSSTWQRCHGRECMAWISVSTKDGLPFGYCGMVYKTECIRQINSINM